MAIAPRLCATLLAALAAGVLSYAPAPRPANAEAPGGDAALVADIRALSTGSLDGLEVHETPRPVPEAAFIDAEGREVSLADFRGKAVLVNFWATWCAPCRAEMPSIDALARDLSGARFAVVAVSTDFGGLEKPRAFLEQIGTEHLALYLDAEKDLARAAGVTGLPVTLLIDAGGREVARLLGEAKWDTAPARALMSRLMQTAPEG